jgi:hypothetical protein
VVGYADRRLRVPEDPLSSENRRISILIVKPKPKEESASDPQEKPPAKATPSAH